MGKPVGNDIREKKLTLPLIHTLNTCAPALRKKLLRIIKYQHNDREKVQYVMDEVANTGGIRYAEEKMLSFRDEALKVLQQFPASEIRNALEELVVFTTERTK